MKLPIKVERFLRYEMVRAHGYFNMITDPEAITYTGLNVKEYKDVLEHYSEYKAFSESWRNKSEKNEEAFTEYATQMATRVRTSYQKSLKIKKEVEEIMKRALSEPAPF